MTISGRFTSSLFGLILCTFGATATADTVRGFVHSIPPLNIEGQEDSPGIALELVQEMARRANVEMDLRWASFARNSKEVHDDVNGVILPLAYSEKRAPNFTWIAELVEMNSIFVTTGDPINSFDEARGLPSIAVQRGSILMRVLTEQGFENLVEVDDHLMAARQLQAGRVAAWYSSDLPAIYTLRSQGMDLDDFVFGESTRKLDFRLGANLEFDEGMVAALRDAMEAMKADGTVDRIIQKYLG